MKSTGSAVIWWLVQKNNDVEGTVRLIGSLAQLWAAANDVEVPELFRHLVPAPALPGRLPFDSLGGDHQLPDGSFPDGSHQIRFPQSGLPAGPYPDFSPVVSQCGALMNTLGFTADEQRALFARYFARLSEKFGKHDEAQEIRRHFDASATDNESVDLPVPDGDLLDRTAPDVELPRQEPWRDSPLSGESV